MSHQEAACSQTIVKVTKENLPLCCPMPEQAVWNAHPRVYLPIEKTGHAKCEYCGAQYILTDFTPTLTEHDKTDVEYADN